MVQKIYPNTKDVPERKKTLIIRHKKENLKKCSLSGLEKRDDFHFLTYPLNQKYDFAGYLLLSLDERAPLLAKEDLCFGLLFLDGTWNLAQKMERNIGSLSSLPKRSLPSHFKTAYPRKQTHCPDSARGLASIEAILVAYFLLGKDTQGLLDHYYWKDSFLVKNETFLAHEYRPA